MNLDDTGFGLKVHPSRLEFKTSEKLEKERVL
jgi:hypothetical protein